MMFKSALVSSVVFTSTSLFAVEPPREAIKAFQAKATVVVQELAKDAPDAELVVSTITALLEDAKPVVIAFGQKHTQCAEQLAALLDLYPQIDQWSAQEIRRNIEAGNSLPPAEGCYSARDIVAHPAIVRVLSRDGILEAERARMTREMNEAIEHVEKISADLEVE